MQQSDLLDEPSVLGQITARMQVSLLISISMDKLEGS